jgi:hypothetical protein
LAVVVAGRQHFLGERSCPPRQTPLPSANASLAIEYAFEDDRLADQHASRPSVFTSAVVEGLATGDADRDEDGWVSLNELYDYVFAPARCRGL